MYTCQRLFDDLPSKASVCELRCGGAVHVLRMTRGHLRDHDVGKSCEYGNTNFVNTVRNKECTMTVGLCKANNLFTRVSSPHSFSARRYHTLN